VRVANKKSLQQKNARKVRRRAIQDHIDKSFQDTEYDQETPGYDLNRSDSICFVSQVDCKVLCDAEESLTAGKRDPSINMT
jgi:hypothetical protein